MTTAQVLQCKNFKTAISYSDKAVPRPKNFNDMLSRFDTISVCDGRTDRHTELLHRYPACIHK